MTNRQTKSIYFYSYTVVVSVLISLCSAVVVLAENPQEVKVIGRGEARYDSPEHAYAAIMSAMVKGDANWYYDSLTKSSADKERAFNEGGGGDLQMKFDMVKSVRSVKILEKKPYKDGVFLLIEATDPEGTIMKGPSVFMMEDGQWKSELHIPINDPIFKTIQHQPPSK